MHLFMRFFEMLHPFVDTTIACLLKFLKIVFCSQVSET